MEFFDTHAHLAMLTHGDLADILKRAQEVGIPKMVSVSVDESSWEKNQKIAESHENIYFTLGLHPHDAKEWKAIGNKILPIYQSLKNKKKCVAIGETGLDFFYNKSERDVQIESFEEQLTLAKSLNLPIVIHCRDAFAETFASVRKIGLGQTGGVMHCFTGDKKNAFDAIDLGLKISFSGILTFKNAVPIQEAAQAIPSETIVIETDCPFLAPIPNRGKPNEPSFLIHTATTLAALRKTPLSEIAEFTTQNAKQLFGLAE
jgi:TatD DNase family protein